MSNQRQYLLLLSIVLVLLTACEQYGNVSLTNGYEYDIVVHTFYDYNSTIIERFENFYPKETLFVAARSSKYNNITAIQIETLNGAVLANYTPEYLMYLRKAYKEKKEQEESWIFTEKGLFLVTDKIINRYKINDKINAEKIFAYYRSDEAVRDLENLLKRNSADIVQRNNENPVLSNNKPVYYFSEEFVERAIKNPNLLSEEIVIFDDSLEKWKNGPQGKWMGNLRLYYGGLLSYGSDIARLYIEYRNYNILLVTQKSDGVEYVCDYLILEKQNPETHLSNGAVQINGEYWDEKVDVVVNHNWRRFTDDISQAFKVNPKTKKIEPFIFNTIRLYSEI